MTLVKKCQCCGVEVTTGNAHRVMKQIEEGERRLWFNCPNCETSFVKMGKRMVMDNDVIITWRAQKEAA